MSCAALECIAEAKSLFDELADRESGVPVGHEDCSECRHTEFRQVCNDVLFVHGEDVDPIALYGAATAYVHGVSIYEGLFRHIEMYRYAFVDTLENMTDEDRFFQRIMMDIQAHCAEELGLGPVDGALH